MRWAGQACLLVWTTTIPALQTGWSCLQAVSQGERGRAERAAHLLPEARVAAPHNGEFGTLQTLLAIVRVHYHLRT